jgi:TolB-like protein
MFARLAVPVMNENFLSIAMKYFCCLILISTFTFVNAQKIKEHSEVVAALVGKIESIIPAGKQFRIAVVPFVSSNSAETSKAFGEYLTESITGKLSDQPQAFKVFERQRLDAVFKENELMLSGLMKPSEALKIGQLLPIDALFSGTYTKLKTYVEVSGRLIDVTSGEIMTSYSGRIKMTKNIKTLFEASIPTPSTQINSQNAATPANITIVNQINSSQQVASKNKAEICKEKVKAFRIWLEDLSTPEKINAAINEGMKTPFDNLCGQLHYDLIYSLSRYHLYPSSYKRFLAATLDTIAFPTNDERAYEICRYWNDDKHIDEEEWRSGFSAMKKIGNYSLSSYVSSLIGRTEDSPEQLKDRINQLMELAQNQKLGLPRPMAYNDAFLEVWEGIYKNELKIYLYEAFSKNLTIDGKFAPKIYSKHNSLYKDCDRQEDKSKVLNWLIRFFNEYSFEKAHEELYNFAFQFQPTSNESTNQRISKEYPAADLKILVNQCKNRFTEYALLSPYNSQKEDRINFCVQNNIPIPGVIPTTTEADNILKGNNLDEQLRVMNLLVQMKAVSKTLEPTLISLLDKKSLEDKEKMTEIQSLATEVLGHLKTSNTRAIDRMIQMVTSYNYQEADRAKAALVEIGKPAVQPLIKRLQSTTEQEDGLRYQIILMLGKIGKDAKPAEATLSSLLQKTTNSDVRYIIEATLDAIK